MAVYQYKRVRQFKNLINHNFYDVQERKDACHSLNFL